MKQFGRQSSLRGGADTETTVEDADGRPIWVKYGNGPISYTAYDEATGAIIKTITDVNTNNTSDFANLPAGWATAPGFGLHLITRYEVDSQGRVTKVATPDGNVTYTVYNDALHETRVYPGFNGCLTPRNLRMNAA